MMMMAEGILGPCSDQVIEGVTVKVESDEEGGKDYQFQPSRQHNNNQDALNYHHHLTNENIDMEADEYQEVIETVTLSHSSHSAACANCSISFFDPVGNEVFQRIFYMCLDSNTNEAIQISSVIHILFAKKLARCPTPSSDLALCNKCAELVARMYQLYRELDELSAFNAYINSFLGNSNSNEGHSSSSKESRSSTPGINYSHYEDSITAAIRASNGHSNPPVAGIEERIAAKLAGQKIISEPPPLTYPSYFLPPMHPNSFIPFTSTPQYIPNEVQVKQEIPNTNVVSPDFALSSQKAQCLPKGKKSKVETTQRNATSEAVVPPVPSESETEKHWRVVNCPEEGCPKVYHGRGARASLRQHIKIFHLKQFPHFCQICQKPMATRNLLDAHIKTHLGPHEKAALASSPAEPVTVSNNPCPECGKFFSTAYVLSLHFNRQHRTESEAQFFHCQVGGCTKKFRDKSSLRRHEVKHQLPDFGCSRCPARFDNKKLLKEHQSGCAVDERHFICRAENCKRRFKYKHHLQNHYMFQHKVPPEEARQEVYPGLAVKEWMSTPRKKSRKAVSTTPATAPQPNITVSDQPSVNSTGSFPNQNSRSEHSRNNQEQILTPSSSREFQNSTGVELSQNNVGTLGSPTSVIQATSAALHQSSVPAISLALQNSSVIQPNPSVIQENPALLHQNSGGICLPPIEQHVHTNSIANSLDALSVVETVPSDVKLN